MALVAPSKYRLRASADSGSTWKTIMDETQLSRDSSSSQSSVNTKDGSYTRPTDRSTSYSVTAYKNDTPDADTWLYEDVSGWEQNETVIMFEAGGIDNGMKYETFSGIISNLSWSSNNDDPGVQLSFTVTVQGNVTPGNTR